MAWVAAAIPIAIAIMNKMQEAGKQDPAPNLAGQPHPAIPQSSAMQFQQPGPDNSAFGQAQGEAHGQSRLRDMLGSGGGALTAAPSFGAPAPTLGGGAAQPNLNTGASSAAPALPPQASPIASQAIGGGYRPPQMGAGAISGLPASTLGGGYQPPPQEATPPPAANAGAGANAGQYAQLAQGIMSLMQGSPMQTPTLGQPQHQNIQPSALQFLNRRF